MYFVVFLLVSFVLFLLAGVYLYMFPTFAKPKKSDREELVVAACGENLDWIDRCASLFKKVTVYNKCGRDMQFKSINVQIVELPNIGSCDYAFLTYVIDRYDDLPEFIEFTKGSQPANRKYQNCRPCWMQFWKKWNGAFKLRDWNFTNHKSDEFNNLKWHNSGYDNFRDWVRAQPFLSESLFEKNKCNVIHGGHFGATANQVRKTPKDTWIRIRAQQKHAREEVDHFIERTWRVLLCR